MRALRHLLVALALLTPGGGGRGWLEAEAVIPGDLVRDDTLAVTLAGRFIGYYLWALQE